MLESHSSDQMLAESSRQMVLQCWRNVCRNTFVWKELAVVELITIAVTACCFVSWCGGSDTPALLLEAMVMAFLGTSRQLRMVLAECPSRLRQCSDSRCYVCICWRARPTPVGKWRIWKLPKILLHSLSWLDWRGPIWKKHQMLYKCILHSRRNDRRHNGNEDR